VNNGLYHSHFTPWTIEIFSRENSVHPDPILSWKSRTLRLGINDIDLRARAMNSRGVESTRMPEGIDAEFIPGIIAERRSTLA
jgi:hypothetical protein